MRAAAATRAVLSVLVLLWLACQCGGPPPQPDCITQECLRAIRCVKACGEVPVQIGCCPCPVNAFDDVACTAADGGDGG